MTMKNAGTAALLALGLVVTAIPAEAHGGDEGPGYYGMGPGMMGPGYYGMGPGMMGPGYYGMGPGMMGPGYGPGPRQPGWRMGPGMMGPGYYRMGPGMMGPGYGMGPGMMYGYQGPGYGGPGYGGPPQKLDLSADDVRSYFEHWLAAGGNKRLKVGKVEALNDNIIEAQIETVDGSLVATYKVDRHTGAIAPAG